MFFYFQKLREKPRHVRQRIAAVVSVVLTSIIFFVWISTLSLNSHKEVTVSKGIAPVVYLKNGLVGIYKDAVGNFNSYSGPTVDTFKKSYQQEAIIIDAKSNQKENSKNLYQREAFSDLKKGTVNVYDRSLDFDFMKNKAEWIDSDFVKYERGLGEN